MATANNVLSPTTRTELRDALRDAANATRADRRAHLNVGRVLMTATDVSDAQIAKEMREDGFSRSKGWYSQIRTAYLNAIVRGGLTIQQAAWDRGDEDSPGGIGGLYGFYNASKDVSDEDMPAFVHAWIRGIDPDRPDPEFVSIRVSPQDRERFRAWAKEAGISEDHVAFGFLVKSLATVA